jgi:hypothetical protein
VRDQYATQLSNRKNLFQLGGDSWTLTVNVWGMLTRIPIPYRRLYGAHLSVGEEKRVPRVLNLGGRIEVKCWTL